MEFRVLKYFLAVARTENISRAAVELNISQPALSRQLMDLEDELGVKLFFRNKKRTTLTEAGYLLKKRAEEINALMEKAVD
ncbi:MAG: LysR family transcriptional regulator [Selenomonadaceae bacterium]|nr:LysR family transcriptional regulator [Selenomonadaceae bacterium]